jgi:hypothetical protein
MGGRREEGKAEAEQRGAWCVLRRATKGEVVVVPKDLTLTRLTYAVCHAYQSQICTLNPRPMMFEEVRRSPYCSQHFSISRK